MACRSLPYETTCEAAVRFLPGGRLLRGKFNLLAGFPDASKSTLACEIAARVSRGETWLDRTPVQESGSVLIVSTEDGVEDTIRPRLEAAGADLDRVGNPVKRDSRHGDRPICLYEDLEEVERALRRDCELLVIDTLNSYLAGDDYQESLKKIASRSFWRFSLMTLGSRCPQAICARATAS